MTKPLVPRQSPSLGYWLTEKNGMVLSEDATWLERCVEAADEMQMRLTCWRNVREVNSCPQGRCTCPPCEYARAYDTVRKERG